MGPAAFLAMLVFAVVAVSHLARVLFQVDVVIGGTAIPLWVSGVGFLITAALAFGLWREGHAG